ncbi:putative ATP-dependent RNA helicase dhx33 [Melipona bicolor]|uniref:RNA helicase n=1 Tax=Melipona bicolor TaxID=60889 RepID=A0AA40FFN7_9HYME|nr:putative ATP-dependent RNA helicase dhx33 [Melipona bicolor]
MGVHDNADSKYIVIGNSSFSKLASKRPTTVVFNESSSKIQKYEDNQQNIQAENADKGNINLQQQRKSLPVYKLRKRLLEEIRRNSTLIIIGETGSGKTTQIPQLLLSSGIAGSSGCVGVTQPRRVAAVSVARRVALEQGVETGKLVGYCVRFEDVTSSQTRIKYLTDGMMVREAMTDEILSDYSVVILDEAHERSGAD